MISGINGLKGNEWNAVNTSDPNSKRVYVNKNAHYLNECDPGLIFFPITSSDQALQPRRLRQFQKTQPQQSVKSQWPLYC